MLNKKEDTTKVTFWSVLICGIFLILSIAILIFAFSDITSVSRLSPIYFIIINSRLSAFLERPEAIFIFIWTLALMSFINIAIMFVLNIFKKLTNVKEPKFLAIAVGSIIFVLAMSLNSFFNFELVANAFYKYGTLILVFIVFTIILIFANIKKRKLKRK